MSAPLGNDYAKVDYELDWNRSEQDNLFYVGVLTGLPESEILSVCPNRERGWRGPEFIDTFKKLGFNTSEKFIKFDPDTDKPCLLRTTSDIKGQWYVWIYHNGVVNGHMSLEEWHNDNPELRITSMLQVWI